MHQRNTICGKLTDIAYTYLLKSTTYVKNNWHLPLKAQNKSLVSQKIWYSFLCIHSESELSKYAQFLWMNEILFSFSGASIEQVSFNVHLLTHIVQSVIVFAIQNQTSCWKHSLNWYWRWRHGQVHCYSSATLRSIEKCLECCYHWQCLLRCFGLSCHFSPAATLISLRRSWRNFVLLRLYAGSFIFCSFI